MDVRPCRTAQGLLDEKAQFDLATETRVSKDLNAAATPNCGEKRGLLNAACSTRMRTLFTVTGMFLLCVSLIVLVSALIINRMKDELVEVAHEEANRIAEYSVAEIEKIVSEYEHEEGRPIGSLAEVANDPAVKAQLRIMSNNGAVVMSAMIDNEGNCFYQQFGGEEATDKCPLRKGQSLAGIIPASDKPLTWELEFREYPQGVKAERLPVRSGERTLGYVTYGLEKDLTLASLDPVSARIERSLIWMVLAVIGCLALAMAMLHIIWKRHHELQQVHAEAQHLANIGTLASGLAHEIRNPLHAMNLHLESAREELEDPRDNSPEFAAKTIGNVQRQIQSLNAIVSNFMNFALPSSLETEPIRLGSLLGEVATLMEPEFEERDARLIRDVPENAWINADQTAVRQVLTNILLNAAQALENVPRREVHVRAVALETGVWRLFVEDTGPGLPEGKAEEIFQVFVTGRRGGSGFGLPIARRIVEAHGGRIVGENRPEGGARFVIDLPAAATPFGYAARDGKPAPAKNEGTAPAVIG
ncbi:MAG: two-component system, NtrC family, sensor histidine kinase HydH [Candidatus Sumerlaeota bacterium]|nr:two-component system, NtrC family, sensor histidine kinase HydH [Candidatus Sumerlaeota bacterium]